MVEAGERILECYRVLRKTGDNVVGEVLRGQGEFFEMDHYPNGDAYDPETHSQYYYHSHRDDEHGHFHTFLRENGMPKGVAPIEQSEAPFMGERDDTLSHLIAISMNRAGYPIRLFTTNRWVGAEHWYEAEDVITMLDSFMMDMAQPSWPVNIWITNMVAPVPSRDRRVGARAGQGGGGLADTSPGQGRLRGPRAGDNLEPGHIGGKTNQAGEEGADGVAELTPFNYA